jgi:hypothetical protein
METACLPVRRQVEGEANCCVGGGGGMKQDKGKLCLVFVTLPSAFFVCLFVFFFNGTQLA